VPRSFRLSVHARSREAWELGDGDAEEMVVEFTGGKGPTRAASTLGTPIRGTRRRAFQVRRREPFARWLLSFGGDAKPVATDELLEAYRKLALESHGVYRDE
jgi:hypothetical protein